MQIVAFDTDNKADGSGKAKITWISRGILPTLHSYGSSTSWETSDMRSYIDETIKPLIPSDVRNNLVPVSKLSKTGSGTVTTTDTVWIPSFKEVSPNSILEETDVKYPAIFSSANESRIKKQSKSSGANNNYWTRTISNNNPILIKYDGSNTSNYQGYRSYGVVFGFCT